MHIKILLPILLSLLTACVGTAIFDTSEVDESLTPEDVIADPALKIGQSVLWGGTILETHNLGDSTQIEMLAYPLSSSHRPKLEEKPIGRFIIQQQGYLEPTTYEQGRQLTAMGDVSEVTDGKVGDSKYSYPIINVQQLKLWKHGQKRGGTYFHFGVGIRL